MCKSVTSSHLNRSSSHLHIFTSTYAIFTFSHLHISSLHPRSFSFSHRRILHLHMFSLSLSSAHLHVFTSSLSPSLSLLLSHLHILNLGHLLSNDESYTHTCGYAQVRSRAIRRRVFLFRRYRCIIVLRCFEVVAGSRWQEWIGRATSLAERRAWMCMWLGGRHIKEHLSAA